MSYFFSTFACVREKYPMGFAVPFAWYLFSTTAKLSRQVSISTVIARSFHGRANISNDVRFDVSSKKALITRSPCVTDLRVWSLRNISSAGSKTHESPLLNAWRCFAIPRKAELHDLRSEESSSKLLLSSPGRLCVHSSISNAGAINEFEEELTFGQSKRYYGIA